VKIAPSRGCREWEFGFPGHFLDVKELVCFLAKSSDGGGPYREQVSYCSITIIYPNDMVVKEPRHRPDGHTHIFAKEANVRGSRPQWNGK